MKRGAKHFEMITKPGWSKLKIDKLLGFSGPEDDGQQNINRGQCRFDIGRPAFVLEVVELALVEGIEQQHQPDQQPAHGQLAGIDGRHVHRCRSPCKDAPQAGERVG